MGSKLSSYRYLLIFLVLFSVTSLAGNILLFKKLKQTYLSFYQANLNPLGINKYRNRQEPYFSNKSRVIFYGDSRAYQWRYLQKDNSFQFINRGINGQTSSQVLWRFDTDITKLKPKVIVLQVCINDLRMLPNPPKTRNDIVENCQNNIKQIIERADSINADIIVTTIFPVGQGQIPLELRPFWPSLNQMKRSIREVNQYIRSLTRSKPSGISNRVIVLDAYSLLNQQDQDKLKYYKDLLHINQEGYKLLNQELKSILNDISTES